MCKSAYLMISYIVPLICYGYAATSFCSSLFSCPLTQINRQIYFTLGSDNAADVDVQRLNSVDIHHSRMVPAFRSIF
jgi:hypothetical protein